jgi:hypothetical protein
MTNTAHRVEGGGREGGLIGPRHEIPRKLFRLDIACVVFFIATRSLKGRKGEREKFERRDEGIMYY